MTDKYPENTKNELYLFSTRRSLSDLIEEAKDHFGDRFDMEKITIRSEYIHTRCVGYVLYDSTDYDDYIILELEE